MIFIKETRTGHYHPATIQTEITEEEALKYLSKEAIEDILNNKTARYFGAAVLQEVADGLYVGVQF